jgi:DNA-binding response OmpR family regulator
MTEHGGGPLVLLAEDDDEMRGLIAARLVDEGMQVVEVEDGFELRDYLSLCRPGGDLREPDIVVADVRMPGESGPDALLHTYHHPPVVLISSVVDDEVRAYAERIGVEAVFQKPFAMRDLVGVIRRVGSRFNRD